MHIHVYTSNYVPLYTSNYVPSIKIHTGICFNSTYHLIIKAFLCNILVLRSNENKEEKINYIALIVYTFF